MAIKFTKITTAEQNVYGGDDFSAFYPKKARRQPQPAQALTVDEFCSIVGVSRSTLYKANAQNQIRTIKFCGRRLIPVTEVERILAGGLK